MSEETNEIKEEFIRLEIESVNEDISELSMEELIIELDKLSDIQNPYSVSKKVEEIKTCFYKKLKNEISLDSEQENLEEEEKKKTLHPLEIRFKKSNNIFRKIKSDYRKKREEEEKKNLIIKQNIITDIDALRQEEESVKVTFEKFKSLQEKWKKTGNVPIVENNDIWQNYHHHVELFYDYLKINRELRDLDFKRNLEQKTLLCEKAEQLTSDKSINKSFNSLQELHEHWKSIGPVVREKREEVWERFQKSSRKINKKRNDFFLSKKEDGKKNFELKLSISKQIRGLSSPPPTSHQQWNEISEKLKSLSAKWKKAAPVDKNDLKKAWEDFRDSNNEFFNQKNNFYKERKENNSANLLIKTTICSKAEELSTSTQWDITGKKLIKLQEEWKNSPFVPNNISAPIWKRFRSACNVFFNERKNHYKKLDIEREDNLKQKELLLLEVQKFKVSEDVENDIKTLQEFSKSWNKIGFIPKKSLKTNDIFNKLISTFYNSLKIEKSEKDNIQFKSKAESLKGNTHQLNKEKEYLRTEIEKVNKTINQYENNISFFGHGKGTEKLKEDVLKKIEKSKLDIDQLKNKLSLLNKI